MEQAKFYPIRRVTTDRVLAFYLLHILLFLFWLRHRDRLWRHSCDPPPGNENVFFSPFSLVSKPNIGTPRRHDVPVMHHFLTETHKTNKSTRSSSIVSHLAMRGVTMWEYVPVLPSPSSLLALRRLLYILALDSSSSSFL